MDRLKALKFFEEAPESTLFDQKLIAVVRDCSTFTLERDRTRGGGIPFVKINRSVRYRKSDVLQWLNQYKPRVSTTH